MATVEGAPIRSELLNDSIKAYPETPPSGTPQSVHSSSPQSEQSSAAYNSSFTSQSSTTSPVHFTANIEYMQQLLKDRHRLSELALSPGFHHLDRLLDSGKFRIRFDFLCSLSLPLSSLNFSKKNTCPHTQVKHSCLLSIFAWLSSFRRPCSLFFFLVHLF